MKTSCSSLLKPCALLAIALAGITAQTRAETIWGLSSTGSIFSFDSASPAMVSLSVPISGVTTGSIFDIDFSPVNSRLYGMATNGDLYSINTATGLATLSIGIGMQNPANTITAPTAMDFNPAADRLRVFQGANNFRITADASSFDNAGLVAGVVSTDGPFTGLTNVTLAAAAYTNPVNGTTSTTLFSIDSQSDRLIVHSVGPQFSTLGAVGPLGVDVGTMVGFDISPSQGTAAGYVSDGNNFYTVNLTTGVLTPAGVIGGGAPTTRSIAAVPEPTSAVLAAMGALGLMVRRRR